MNKLIKNIKEKKVEIASGVIALTPGLAFATTPTLSLNIDLNTIFNYSNQFLGALMPIVGLTIGLSLAMMVIRTLKNMFF